MSGGDLRWETIQPALSQIGVRLEAIEQQLETLSKFAGVPYSRPNAAVPPEVVELARAGKTIEAMRLYRQATNAGPDEARAVVMGL